MTWMVLPLGLGVGLLIYLAARRKTAGPPGMSCQRCRSKLQAFPATAAWTRLSKCSGPEPHYAVDGTHLRYGEISIPVSASVGARMEALSAEELEAVFADLDLFGGLDTPGLEAILRERLN